MLSSAMTEAHLCEKGMYFVTDCLLLYVQFIKYFERYQLSIFYNSDFVRLLDFDRKLCQEWMGCSNCSETVILKTSPTATNRGQLFDVNRRAIYYALELGVGYQVLVTPCTTMNMPCMSQPTYYNCICSSLLPQWCFIKSKSNGKAWYSSWCVHFKFISQER